MDNNSFDWLAVQMQSGNKSFGDLNAMGVDPSNTSLESADFYKQQPKIKDTFKKTDGSFDNDAFNAFYTNAAKSLNTYKQSDSSINNVTTDVWADGSISRNLGMTIRNKPVTVSLPSKEPFTALKQAQGSFYGMTEINKWTKPTKSIAEVAQGRSVIDGETGKQLDYTPEDTNLFNLYGFFKEPLVLATYDDDVKDAKGQTLHKKGEFKFDDKGLPFYETLAGRDPSGKQILSRLDTFTKEGSFANKFDFMDSDDLQKSMTGTLVKSAVQIAPFLIGGPVSTAYTAYYIASGLADASGEILKTVDGLMEGKNAKNSALYKWANSLQGYTGQWKSGMSDYGKDNFFSLENLLGQAVDSVYQLKSQEAIVKWPLEFAKYQMAKSLGVATEGALDVGEEATKKLYQLQTYADKYGTDFVKSAQLLSTNVDKLNQYETYAQHISRAYMAATSAVGISQAAKQAGLDARDTGFLYAGYTAALYGLFGTEYAHFVEKRIGGLDDFARGTNAMLGREGSTMLPKIAAEVESTLGQAATGSKAKALNMLATGKQFASNILKKVNELDARTAIGASAKEGFEEITEQSIQDALQLVYNGFHAAGLTSTQDKDAKFDTDPMAMAQDIAMNGIGGVLGGAIFHYVSPAHGGHNFKADRLIDYVVEGYGDDVQKRISDMKGKGEFGDTALSISPLLDANGVAIQGMYAPVSAQNPTSQNDFIADNLSKTITVLEQLKKQYNVENPSVSAAAKAKFYQGIVDPGTDTDFKERLNQTITDIFKKSAEIASVDGLDKETNEGMLTKKAELRQLQKDLEYLQGDESVDEFFVQGLFNIRSDVNEAFGVKNRETMAQAATGKSYTQLTDAQKVKIDQQYDEYKSSGSLRNDLKQGRMAYAHFDDIMESKGHYRELDAYKESVEHLKKYIVTKENPYTPDGETEPVAVGITYELVADYLNKMQGVKYIPDYIFERLKRTVQLSASDESRGLLDHLTNHNNTLKVVANSGLRTGLEDSTIREFVKDLLGDKVFNEVTSTDEYKDILNNKIPSDYSTMKLLKQLASLKGTVDTSKLDLQKLILKQIDSIDSSDIDAMMESMDNGSDDKSNPAYQYFDQFDGLFDHIQTLRDQGLDSLAYEDLFSRDKLNQFIHATQVEKTLKRALTPEEKEGLINSIDPNNIFISLLTGDQHELRDPLTQIPLEVIHSQSIKAMDDTSVRKAMDMLNDFDQKRLSSPLKGSKLKNGEDAKILEDVYAFVNDQKNNLAIVGISNYLNADKDFISSFDIHRQALEKVFALVGAADTLNPIINDFRANHKGIIGDVNKDKVLNILDPQDVSTLQYEMQRLGIELKYLKDVNNYNVNNVLQRLLKEDGFELVQKVNALRDIMSTDGVIDLLPSLSTLQDIDEINKYVDGYKTASDEDKFNGLYRMAKFENDIFTDVQKLSRADKAKLINLTFKPINADNSEFYDNIDPEKDLNDSHKTIYLASIFGSSTLEFYKKYAGEEDIERGVFKNLDNSPYIPFAKQESAVRLFDLVANGDQDIIQYLRNAYTYKDGTDSIDFTKEGNTDISNTIYGSNNLINVIGSPGAGKTSAVLAMIMNIVDHIDSNTIILAPKQRQLNGLQAALVKAGFESRIDSRSGVVKDFLQSLGLKTKDGVLFDFNTTDDIINSEPTDVSNSKYWFDNAVNVTDTTKPMMGILSKLDLYGQDKKLRDEVRAAFANIKTFVLDEFTHVNPVDIAILTHLIESYNQTEEVQVDPTKRITMVNLGDNNQMGFVNHNNLRRDFTSVSNSIITQPLLTSLRTGWDLLNNTMVDVTRRTIEVKQMAATDSDSLETSDTLERSRIPIQLQHTTGPQGSIGIKSINSATGVTAADLTFISDNKDKLVGKDVVYVVKDKSAIPKAQAILASAFGADWTSKAHIEIYTPDEVQGGEYKYAIIDAQPKLAGNPYDIVRTHEFLNTMLSRATEATLLVDNGSMSQFVKFENEFKDRAIKQVKINDDIIAKVKDNKQKLFASILRDYTSPEFKGNAAKPVSDGNYMTVAPLEPLLFNQPPGHIDEVSAKVSDIIAYSTFNTSGDIANVASLMKISNPDDEKQKNKVELAINSLKYYIMKGDEIGQSNVNLASNFIPHFSEYNYRKPKFFIEARKMSGPNALEGRSEDFPDKELVPNTPALYLKVKLDNNIPGKPPVVLTMGLLNSLKKLNDKYRGKTKLDSKDEVVQQFVQGLGTFFAGRSSEVLVNQAPFGTISDGVWTSKEYTKKEWDKMTQIWGSRLFYKSGTDYKFNKFQQKFKDFYISDPQVVVASLKDEQGKSILDSDGSNAQYRRYWGDLQGKSIAFMSEYKELQHLSTDQVLKLYLKQLAYFNNDEFKKSPAKTEYNTDGSVKVEGKDLKVLKITERITIPNVTVPLSFKPNMIQLIRLDNPRASFMNFREQFLNVIGKHVDNMPIQQLFETFDMTPYVKDRLVKSLLTMRQFLNTKEGKDYFTKNILNAQNIVAEDRIEQLRQYALDNFGETGDFDDLEHDKEKHESWDDVILGDLGKYDSVDDFIKQLDDVLSVGGKHSIFLRKFVTKDATDKGFDNARVNKMEPQQITQDDLNINLSSNKQVDFSDSILDLNLLNLFKKTKNLNFAEVLDKAFKEFANLPKEPQYDKYRLDSVFKNGEIETMVVANSRKAKGGNSDNILADVKRIGSTFSFNFGGIQQAAYNIDFSQVISTMTEAKPEVTDIDVKVKEPKIFSRLDALSAELPEDWFEQKFRPLIDTYMQSKEPEDSMEALDDLERQLNLLNDTVRMPLDNLNLTPDTMIAIDVSPNGVIGKHTVQSDVSRILTNNYGEFKGIEHPNLDLQFVESNQETATFLATNEEGKKFKVTYFQESRTLKLERQQYVELDPVKEFKLAGDGKTPEQVMKQVVDEVSKAYLPTGRASEIANVNDMKSALGMSLENTLSEEQFKLVDYNPQHPLANARDLFDRFVDKYYGDETDWVNKLVQIAHQNIDGYHANALSVTNEETPTDATTYDSQGDVDDFIKTGSKAKTKEVKITDPMELVKKDLTEANKNAKEEFDIQVRTAFSGAQNNKPVKEWVDVYRQAHRSAIVNEILKNANEKLGADHTLSSLGILDDIANLDPVKLMNDVMMAQQRDPAFKAVRSAFKALNDFRIQKTKQC